MRTCSESENILSPRQGIASLCLHEETTPPAARDRLWPAGALHVTSCRELRESSLRMDRRRRGAPPAGGGRQFAEISGGFLAWEFELKDEAGGTLALIDRNFAGFGVELFTVSAADGGRAGGGR